MDIVERRQKNNEYNKKWREKHKEEWLKYAREYQQKYRNEHPEKHKRYTKTYYESNKDKIYKQQQEYRHKNSKHISYLVSQSKHRRVERLRAQGVINAWSVVNYQKEPKYKEVK